VIKGGPKGSPIIQTFQFLFINVVKNGENKAAAASS
jgi:hypothetical protein